MTRDAYQIGVSYDLILQNRRIFYQIKPRRPDYLLTQNILFSYVTIICRLVNKTAIFLEIGFFIQQMAPKSHLGLSTFLFVRPSGMH